MTDAIRSPHRRPGQIHAPLQAWFASKASEPAPEHLIALVDELAAMTIAPVRKVS